MTQLLIADFSGYVQVKDSNQCGLQLIVGGMHCAGCAFKIEKALNANENVQARVNVTEKRLNLQWQGQPQEGNALVEQVRILGFELSPLTVARQSTDDGRKTLLRSMAVSGFAAGNIMMFSFALWFTPVGEMTASVRHIFHWFSALLALPTITYAGQVFFKSAWRALRHGRGNMDVPIAVALVLASALSLQQTIVHGTYVFFDSVTMLLFFLLVGRHLDARARAHTRDAAADVLALMQGDATVIEQDGSLQRLPASALAPGMTMRVAKGETILADGRLLADTLMETAAFNGESVPRIITAGQDIYAGMINLGEAVQVTVQRAQDSSVMSEIAALMEKANQSKAKYVQLADRISSWYTPVVHVLALLTFLGWWQFSGAPWQLAIMYAATVLIITCPCALALAVPVSQVVAVSTLFRKGLLMKSADAFERMAAIDTIIFDKTGTLTTGELKLLSDVDDIPDHEKLALSAVAAQSSHPLSRAIWRALGKGHPLPQVYDIREVAGAGIEGVVDGVQIKIGSARFFALASMDEDNASQVYCRCGADAVRVLSFSDELYDDAVLALKKLADQYRIVLLSGDHAAVTKAVAQKLGISLFYAGVDPLRKHDIVAAERAQGARVLMVGDGMNDAAAMSCATASLSPSTAVGIAQNAADIVYQSRGVMPVVHALETACRVERVIKQNFIMALLYNVLAVPLAVVGLVTPLIAALAMSTSSLAVILNALRLRKERTWMF